MLMAFVTTVATTTIALFTEGVCTAMAGYSIAKGVGKASFSFKK